MADSHDFGAKAEDFAAQYMLSKGFCILHRNWTYDHKELDIVCTDGRILIIAEVKARQCETFPLPEDLLTRAKERFILEASEEYLYRFGVTMPVRFDLLAVIGNDKKMDIQHIEDAIIPFAE